MSDKDVDRLSVLVEQVVSQNKAVLEAVADIRRIVEDQPTRDEFNELKREVQAIKLAVTDLSHDLNEHKANDRIHFMPSIPRAVGLP